MHIWVFGFLALLSACDDKADVPVTPDEGVVEITDEDNDGAAAEIDCDDNNPQAHPGALEVCDGVDNDCDGETDEEAIDATTVYTDVDGDGFGDPATAETTCDTEGTVPNGDDCDDTNADNFPGNTEVCDGIDNDCDGSADNDATDAATWYADADGDGFGDPATASVHCDAAEGEVSDGTDCDDDNVDAYPEAIEVCDGADNDCDGEVDTDAEEVPTWYADLDGDGFGASGSWDVTSCDMPTGYVADNTDCDNLNPDAYPEAIEVCDGADNNCDGEVDVGVEDAPLWYADADGDGFGDAETSIAACEAPEGHVDDATDCNDAAETAYPDADEICDGLDNDCDTEIDEDSEDRTTYYRDADEDTYGDADDTIEACAAPEGYVEDDTDCNDEDGASNPAGTEVCDDADNDCDGDVDEDVLEPPVWYVDLDSDGYGASGDWDVAACEAPTGYVDNDADCDNLDPAVSPDADEVCDGIDNNCDELTDIDVEGAPMWYADADGDGFGDAEAGMTACDEPDGYVADATDCNDGAATAFPGGIEACDGLDNDCDGELDEDSEDRITFYPDTDEDGYGDPDAAVEACAAPEGYTEDNQDCDDTNIDISPDGIEVCDEADNDCDGETDEDATDAPTWYIDVDEDGYGSSGERDITQCTAPAGYVAESTDCNNLDPAISPDAEEVCDGIDNNCDDRTDIDVAGAPEWYADTDEDGFGDADNSLTACDVPDGYVADATDCDDAAATAYPGGTEACDGLDNDCDGELDEDSEDRSTYYPDVDEDSYGDATAAVEACVAPEGYIEDNQDCDDNNADINPAGTEICDAADNDCDGETDEGATDAPTWYIDFDDDGYGASGEWDKIQCEMPAGYVNVAGDCSPLDADINPGAEEYCDGVDEDCDGEVDDAALDTSLFYIDEDGDGYGTADITESGCSPSPGFAELSGDCNDEDNSISPATEEVPGDAIDQNCDGADEDLGVFLGDITIANDTIAETFCASYSTVAGSLTISGDGLTSLEVLDCLVEVYGYLSIENGGHWDSTNLPHLTTIHGELEVTGEGPTSLSMPVLSSIGDSSTISNTSYDSIDLPSMAEADGQVYIGNSGNETIIDLSGLVSADHVYVYNDGLYSLSLGALVSTGSLYVYNQWEEEGESSDADVDSIQIGALTSTDSIVISVDSDTTGSVDLSSLETVSEQASFQVGQASLDISALSSAQTLSITSDDSAGRSPSSIELANLNEAEGVYLRNLQDLESLTIGNDANIETFQLTGSGLTTLDLSGLSQYQQLLVYCNDNLSNISNIDGHSGNAAELRLWGNNLSWEWLEENSTQLTQIADLDSYSYEDLVDEEEGWDMDEDATTDYLIRYGYVQPIVWATDASSSCEEYGSDEDVGDTGEIEDDDTGSSSSDYRFMQSGEWTTWSNEEGYINAYHGFSGSSYGSHSGAMYMNLEGAVSGKDFWDTEYRWSTEPNEDEQSALLVGGTDEDVSYIALKWEWINSRTLDLCIVEAGRTAIDLSKSATEGTGAGGVCATHADGSTAYWQRLQRGWYYDEGDGDDTGSDDGDTGSDDGDTGSDDDDTGSDDDDTGSSDPTGGCWFEGECYRDIEQEVCESAGGDFYERDNGCDGREGDGDTTSGDETGGDDDDDTGGSGAEREICDDGVDNDEDGYLDCDDWDCGDDPACGTGGDTTGGDDDDDTGGSGAESEICDDGVDNDEDGYFDCDDWDCADDRACGTDSEDEDGDGYTEEDGDCDDYDATIYPDAEEEYDGVDNDCDGEIDEGIDRDGDGYTEEDGDCDDNDPLTHPDAEEELDGVDNDCDGEADEDVGPGASCEYYTGDEGDGILDCNYECVNPSLLGDGTCDRDDSPDRWDSDNNYYNTGDLWCEELDNDGGDCSDDLDGDGTHNDKDCDIDGDGYGTCPGLCITLELADAWGNGWDGAYITVTIDDGTSYDFTVEEGDSASYEVCGDADQTVNIDYTEATFAWQHSYILKDEDGTTFKTGSGSGHGLDEGETADVWDGMFTSETQIDDSDDWAADIWAADDCSTGESTSDISVYYGYLDEYEGPVEGRFSSAAWWRDEDTNAGVVLLTYSTDHDGEWGGNACDDLAEIQDGTFDGIAVAYWITDWIADGSQWAACTEEYSGPRSYWDEDCPLYAPETPMTASVYKDGWIDANNAILRSGMGPVVNGQSFYAVYWTETESGISIGGDRSNEGWTCWCGDLADLSVP